MQSSWYSCVMASKKKSGRNAHRGVQINLRVVDPRIVSLINVCAKSERRSRNLMLNILIEEALKARGHVVEK